MRFTKSMDGHLRANLQVRFRVGILELAIGAVDCALTKARVGGYEDKTGGNFLDMTASLGRREIIDHLRSQLMSGGENWLIRSMDNLDWELGDLDVRREDLKLTLRALLEDHFPELEREIHDGVSWI